MGAQAAPKKPAKPFEEPPAIYPQGSPKMSTRPMEEPAAIPPQGRTFKKLKPSDVRNAVRQRLSSAGDTDHARGPGGGSVPTMSKKSDRDHEGR